MKKFLMILLMTALFFTAIGCADEERLDVTLDAAQTEVVELPVLEEEVELEVGALPADQEMVSFVKLKTLEGAVIIDRNNVAIASPLRFDYKDQDYDLTVEAIELDAQTVEISITAIVEEAEEEE